MNVLFLCVFVLSAGLVIVRDASAFLPALLEGAGGAVTLSLSLAAAYAVWLGFLRVAEDAGFLGGLSRAMLPLTRRLFSTKNEKALEQVSVNLAANLCGMGGAATGAGIAAMRLLDRERYSQEMFFVVNCAGLQLLPSTVLSLRVQAGSADPFSVLLPALLSSLASLLLGVLLVRLFCRR